MTGDEDKVKMASGVKIALVALPLCLLLSTGGAVWYHWHREAEEVADPGLAMMGEGMDRAEVEDLVSKLTTYLSGREWDTPEGRETMRQVVSMVEGTLSPQNYGFVVHKGAEVGFEGELWPMVWVDVEGGTRKGEVVVVCAPYDLGDDGVVALMTVARALRDVEMERTVRFLFYPGMEFVEEESRGESFLSRGEKVVAALGLSSMGLSGQGPVRIVGPDLGALEGLVNMAKVERRVEGRVEERAVQKFGRGMASVLQQFFPSAASSPGEQEVVMRDNDSLMARLRLLAEVVSALAGGA